LGKHRAILRLFGVWRIEFWAVKHPPLTPKARQRSITARRRPELAAITNLSWTDAKKGCFDPLSLLTQNEITAP
jgi:hypothetical protein